ncbi:hypothetical protein QVG61_05850 [Thiohalobacter sp. IOR34]|uniref:hypothetical protein n=1 Tax=Thiohalobacter sp. IOR34 TaxID=3057176 RepID=UPI0025AF09BB|nr:hypothetical protein [Thiohalobacter sp. IOR34]WJW76612.1 hypothetical protein QVG61_05850 [Thiohalobacter sp. IOR34]
MNSGFARYLSILAMMFSLVGNAMAGGFADAFRDFVLGSPAEASVLAAQDQLSRASQARHCMQCHDGSSATAITIKDADSPMQIRGHRTLDHPVGMSYARHARRNPAVYVAPGKLDPRIRLENGTVTCISCHRTRDAGHTTQVSDRSPSSANNCTASADLTTGPEPGRLCIACHAM